MRQDHLHGSFYPAGRILLPTAIALCSVAATSGRGTPQKSAVSAPPSSTQRSDGTGAPDGLLRQKQSTPLRATTRLVALSVVARDKGDQLVPNLDRPDFTVFDNGKPQKIQLFSVTTNRLPAASRAVSQPNTYSNRAPAGDVPANITVILLDALNTPFSNRAFANHRLLKFLQQLQPQDRVALYALGDRLRILHDFTSDASSLIATLQDFKGQLTQLDEPAPPDLGFTGNRAAVMLRGEEKLAEDEKDLARRTKFTLDAMVAIANHLAPLPGRKNLIWLSGSFPLSTAYAQLNPEHGRTMFETQFTNVVEALANDSLVIYPVDARGLVPTDTENFGGPDAFEFMTMKSLAAETGGRAFFGTNDIGGAVRAAIDDSQLSYELGYYPSFDNWDGKFHRVKVRVNRPGVHVRTREGYIALSNPGPTPLETHALDVTVQVDPVETENGRSETLRVTVSVDPRQFALKYEDGRMRGALDLLFTQSNDEDTGKTLDTVTQPYGLMLLPSTYERPPVEGMKFTQEIRIVPKATRLAVAVRDRSAGLGGVVDVPLAKYLHEESKRRD